jgi:ABC-2 type transport system permease protein
MGVNVISLFREIYQYRGMLWGMVSSDLRTRYKGSVFGFLWTFLNPLLMLLVYGMVFKTVMRVSLPHYLVFLFIGLLGWNLFATSILSAVSVINRQSSIIKKIYFPREILPISIVLASTINYLLSLVILLPFLIFSGLYPNWDWVFLPIILLFEVIFSIGLSLFFSAINVFLRDVEHILGIVVMAWFYMTPIVYSLSMIPKGYVQLFKINPVVGFIVSYQDILYYHLPPRWKLFLYSAIISLMVLAFGWMVFRRLNRRFAEEV